MYVSALHNAEGCYPVDQKDPFFVSNKIEFLELPQHEPVPNPQPQLKYVVTLDETGAYRHSIVPVE